MPIEVHQSELNQFARCAYQHYLRHFKGIKIPPGIAAWVGSGAHKGAEINHKQKIDSRIDLPTEEITAASADEYKRLIFEEGVFISRAEASDKSEILRLKGAGLDRAVLAATVYAEQVAPTIQPIAAEEFMRADLGDGMRIAGTVDAIDDAGFVIDLKVIGKRKGQAVADAELQPTFYAVLFREKYGILPNGFRYDQIIMNKTPVYDPLLTTRDDGDIERLKRRIIAYIEAVEAGVFPPCDPGAWICSPKWCGYYGSHCKYTRRR